MRPAVMRRVGALVIALGLLGSLAVSSVLAAAITVTSLADTAADDGVCTLREAITAANDNATSGASAGECAAGAVAGTDTITFSVAGPIMPITLTSALPAITSDLSIDGAGSITVSGASTYQVFLITSGTVTLSGLTITNGLSDFLGGGISNAGELLVVDSTISGSSADQAGGGIESSGTLTVMSSTISGNSAPFGGGIASNGPLTVMSSTISGNSAGGSGGGMLNNTTGSITNSTISGNSTTVIGGGIDNAGTLTITNSTISGNSAQAGGGLYAVGTETLVNAIVAGNTGTAADPDVNLVDPFLAPETITTSVIGVPVGKTLADILDPAGLADNGGPTQTIALALVAGNPAIDTGTSAVCAAAPVNALDQRGLPRAAACDIGAYEAQPPTVAAHANVSVVPTSAAGAVVSYTAPAGTDEQGGTATVACLPASGSTFAVGSTTVTCTATDAVGHTGTGTFSANVSAFVPAASPALLPNTASESGTTERDGVPLTLGLLGLGLVALGLAHRRDRRLRR